MDDDATPTPSPRGYRPIEEDDLGEGSEPTTAMGIDLPDDPPDGEDVIDPEEMAQRKRATLERIKNQRNRDNAG